MEGYLYEIRFKQCDKIKHWLYETDANWSLLARKDIAALRKNHDVHDIYVFKKHRFIGAIRKHPIISIRFHKDATQSYEYALLNDSGGDVHVNDRYSLILQDNSQIIVDKIYYAELMPKRVTKNLVLKPNNQAIVTYMNSK